VARVDVGGWAVQVVPFLRLPIDASAEAPVEEFRAPAG
jgi:hypothetical protein